MVNHFVKKKYGLLFAISSPSGVGKSSLANLLVQNTKAVHSISVTTRSPRGNEKDGVDYHFLSKLEFEIQKEKGAFIEWAEVHGNYYGTLKQNVEDALIKEKDIIFDIDFQGVKQLKKHFPKELVAVFILPPSMNELKKRLEKRGEDDQETIKRRLLNASEEIKQYELYDYVLINSDLSDCFLQLKSIYFSEQLKRVRNPQLSLFVNHLCNENFL